MISVADLEDEIELADRVIMASEDWSKGYDRDPSGHTKLIKQQAKFARALRKYFRELKVRAPGYVNWVSYELKVRELKAAADTFEVDVILEDDIEDLEDTALLKISYDPILQLAVLGGQAGEIIYQKDLGISESNVAIQKAAREQSAKLVGKKLDTNGNIIDNPKAEYRISETTRNQIRESIRTSLHLGEDVAAARERLGRVVNDSNRAQLIANTESVNAYQVGMRTMATETGAVGKEWISSNNSDVCGENQAAGMIGIDDDFPSGDSEPTAHPNCLCDMRYIYQEELEGDF